MHTHERRGSAEASGSLTPTNRQTLYLLKMPLQIKRAYNQAMLIHSEVEKMGYLWGTITCGSRLSAFIYTGVSAFYSVSCEKKEGTWQTVRERMRIQNTVRVCVCVFAWHDSASDATHSLDLDFCLYVTPAAPSSLINRTDEDRLLLLREEKQ